VVAGNSAVLCVSLRCLRGKAFNAENAENAEIRREPQRRIC
jgi:hypothetical protein